MTRKRTGSDNYLTAPRRPRRIIPAFLLSASLVVVLAVALAAEVRGQQTLVCGAPVTDNLVAGGPNTYFLSTLPSAAVLVEAIDTSGTIVIKLKVSADLFACGGTLVIPPGTPKSMIAASDCLGSQSGNYTISAAVVSEGPDNCGVSLPCGSALSGTNVELKVPGEVDSYTFPGVQGDQVSLTVSDVARMIGAIRLRIFDPTGAPVGDSCSGAIGINLPSTGTYTVLVSACSSPPPTGPYAITWQPQTCPLSPAQGQRAYVPNADSATLSVFDLTKDATAAIIPIASPDMAAVGTDTAAAIAPNGGFAYVTYGNSSTLSVINTSTNLLTASVPVGLDTAGVVVSPDGASVYVLANGLSGIAVIDTKTRQMNLISTSDTIGLAGSLEFTPDGASLYVVSDESTGLYAVDPKTGETTGFAFLQNLGVFDALAISPDGATAYVGTLDGIAVVSTALNTVVTTIPLPDEPLDIAFSPDGLRAYASTPDSMSVVPIDTTTQHVLAPIPVGIGPGGLAVSPDGALLYVADSAAAATEPGFFVVDVATGRVIHRAPTFGSGPVGVTLTTAPDGLCVGDGNGETVVTVDEILGAVNNALIGCPGRFPTTISTLTP